MIIKSFETLGLLAVVAVIIMIASRFMDAKTTEAVVYVPNPGWKSLRKGTLGMLIVSVTILALIGILSIWEVITDKDILYKSLGTLAVIAFTSFIVVLTCLGMEHDPVLHEGSNDKKRGMSGGVIALIVIASVILLPYFFSTLFSLGRY